MGQLFFQDNIPELVRASASSVTLAATHMGQPTRITVGGQQYTLTGTLAVNTGTVGAGGLDAGALTTNAVVWYVYAIVNQSSFAPALVASLVGPSSGPTMPLGYGTAYKLVGAFYTPGGFAQVGSPVTIVGAAETDWMSYSATGADQWTTNVTFTTLWKRKGPNIQVQAGIVATGAPSGGDTASLRFYLPATLLISSVSLSSNTANRSSLGHWQGEISGSGNFGGAVRKHTTNDKMELWLTNTPGSASASYDVISTATFTLNGKAFATAEAPIDGWSKTLL